MHSRGRKSECVCVEKTRNDKQGAMRTKAKVKAFIFFDPLGADSELRSSCEVYTSSVEGGLHRWYQEQQICLSHEMMSTQGRLQQLSVRAAPVNKSADMIFKWDTSCSKHLDEIQIISKEKKKKSKA